MIFFLPNFQTKMMIHLLLQRSTSLNTSLIVDLWCFFLKKKRFMFDMKNLKIFCFQTEVGEKEEKKKHFWIQLEALSCEQNSIFSRIFKFLTETPLSEFEPMNAFLVNPRGPTTPLFSKTKKWTSKKLQAVKNLPHLCTHSFCWKFYFCLLWQIFFSRKKISFFQILKEGVHKRHLEISSGNFELESNPKPSSARPRKFCARRGVPHVLQNLPNSEKKSHFLTFLCSLVSFRGVFLS